MPLLIWLLLVISLGQSYSTFVTVDSTNGRIQGKIDIRYGKFLNIYLGVPFAKPPVGEMRFKNPEPLEKSAETLKAFTYPSPCYQRDFNPLLFKNPLMSEDCLYLNIHAPSFKSNQATLIYIYGGSFTMGSISSSLFASDYLAATANMIVVDCQYRVGSFGFLDLKTPGASGNQGLYDQYLCLQWVKENIEKFGGDPNKITISGSSAGSISAGIHLLSNKTSGLFQKAILQSGPPNSGIFGIRNENRTRALQSFYQELACPLPNDTTSMQCLQGKSPDDIIIAEKNTEPTEFFTFLPTIEEEYVNIRSYFDFRPTFLHPADCLISVVKDDGRGFTHLFTSTIDDPDTASKTETMEGIYEYMGGSPSHLNTIIEDYFQDVGENDRNAIENVTSDLVTDFLFKCPALYFSSISASMQKKVFFYHFTHEFALQSKTNNQDGVFHGSDMFYVYGYPHRFPLLFTPKERELSTQMVNIWSSFVKSGTPYSRLYPDWPQVVPPIGDQWSKGPAMEVTTGPGFVVDFPSYEKCTRLWTQFYYPETS